MTDTERLLEVARADIEWLCATVKTAADLLEDGADDEETVEVRERVTAIERKYGIKETTNA